MNFARLIVPLLLNSVLWAAPSARAEVLYSNLGPGDTFQTGISYIVAGTNAPRNARAQAVANNFVSASTLPLTSVDVGINGLTNSETVVLVLYANDPLTNLPSAASMLTLGNVTVLGSSAQLLRLTLDNPIQLFAGVSYWLGMFPGASTTFAGWNLASDREANRSAGSGDGGQTFSANNYASAFRMNADLVPEPSTWTMFGLGIIGLSIVARRHRYNLAFGTSSSRVV